MANILITPDCGNAPRKLFLKSLHIALAEGDLDFITECIPGSITWNIAGHKEINGLDDYMIAVTKRENWKVVQLTVDTIITHGPEASVSGEITRTDGTKYAFCDVYRFVSAGSMKLKTITSFLIKTG